MSTPTLTPDPSPPTPAFFSLPRELRDIIYHHVFHLEPVSFPPPTPDLLALSVSSSPNPPITPSPRSQPRLRTQSQQHHQPDFRSPSPTLHFTPPTYLSLALTCRSCSHELAALIRGLRGKIPVDEYVRVRLRALDGDERSEPGESRPPTPPPTSTSSRQPSPPRHYPSPSPSPHFHASALFLPHPLHPLHPVRLPSNSIPSHAPVHSLLPLQRADPLIQLTILLEGSTASLASGWEVPPPPPPLPRTATDRQSETPTHPLGAKAAFFCGLVRHLQTLPDPYRQRARKLHGIWVRVLFREDSMEEIVRQRLLRAVETATDADAGGFAAMDGDDAGAEYGDCEAAAAEEEEEEEERIVEGRRIGGWSPGVWVGGEERAFEARRAFCRMRVAFEWMGVSHVSWHRTGGREVGPRRGVDEPQGPYGHWRYNPNYYNGPMSGIEVDGDNLEHIPDLTWN